MAIGRQDAPVTYATLDLAKADALANSTVVYALVDSVLYLVYPNGRTMQT